MELCHSGWNERQRDDTIVGEVVAIGCRQTVIEAKAFESPPPATILWSCHRKGLIVTR